MEPVRAGLGLPAVDPASIVVSTDEARCERASFVMDRLEQRATRAAVYLLHYGTYFAAYDPAVRLGEFRPVFFFDSAMTLIGEAAL